MIKKIKNLFSKSNTNIIEEYMKLLGDFFKLNNKLDYYNYYTLDTQSLPRKKLEKLKKIETNYLKIIKSLGKIETKIIKDKDFEHIILLIENLKKIKQNNFYTNKRIEDILTKVYEKGNYKKTKYENDIYELVSKLKNRKQLPRKLKNKTKIVEKEIIPYIKFKKKYTELNLNAKLAVIGFDPASTRRELISFKYIERTKDGRCYWRIK